MALDPKLSTFCTQAGAPDIFQQWLVTCNVLDVETYASLSAKEEDVKDEIVGVFLSEASRTFANIGEKTCALKLWRLCRNANAPSSSSDNSSEKPLADDIAQDLRSKFVKQHNIVLPDSLMLIPTTQDKIYWDINRQKPQLTPLLLEHLRTMATIGKANAQILKYVPGKAIVGAEVVVDTVEGYSEVFTRTKAYFHFLAFCSITNTAFFDLQTAMFASEKIWSLLSITFGHGQKPPVEFYVAAWAQTVHFFSEQLRLTSSTDLRPIVSGFASWERFWMNFVPQSDGNPGGATLIDQDVHLREEVKHLRKQASELQSQRDRAAWQARQPNTGDVLEAGKGRGRGRGRGSNNSGKDGGKGNWKRKWGKGDGKTDGRQPIQRKHR